MFAVVIDLLLPCAVYASAITRIHNITLHCEHAIVTTLLVHPVDITMRCKGIRGESFVVENFLGTPSVVLRAM